MFRTTVAHELFAAGCRMPICQSILFVGTSSVGMTDDVHKLRTESNEDA